jgi:hypothetical protein
MTDRILLHTVFAFLLISLVSCDKKEETSIDKLMPTNTGNSWTFKRTYMYGKSSDTIKLEVGEKVTIHGISCYALAGEEVHNARVIVGNDESGNFVNYGAVSEIDTIFSPSIQYKINAFIGEEWNFTTVAITLGDGEFYKYEYPIKCISKDELITTPIGSFSCIGFESSMSSSNNLFKEYLSKNIGIVKREVYEDGDLLWIDELIEYHLNK